MLMDKVTDSSNSVVQERYITLSVHRKSIEEARTFFDRVVHDVTSRLNHLDSHSEELDTVERLRVLHDFYRTGEETEIEIKGRHDPCIAHRAVPVVEAVTAAVLLDLLLEGNHGTF